MTLVTLEIMLRSTTPNHLLRLYASSDLSVQFGQDLTAGSEDREQTRLLLYTQQK